MPSSFRLGPALMSDPVAGTLMKRRFLADAGTFEPSGVSFVLSDDLVSLVGVAETCFEKHSI